MNSYTHRTEYARSPATLSPVLDTRQAPLGDSAVPERATPPATNYLVCIQNYFRDQPGGDKASWHYLCEAEVRAEYWRRYWNGHSCSDWFGTVIPGHNGEGVCPACGQVLEWMSGHESVAHATDWFVQALAQAAASEDGIHDGRQGEQP